MRAGVIQVFGNLSEAIGMTYNNIAIKLNAIARQRAEDTKRQFEDANVAWGVVLICLVGYLLGAFA